MTIQDIIDKWTKECHAHNRAWHGGHRATFGHCIQDLENYLKAQARRPGAAVQEAPSWQPIDSAPKGGASVLVRSGDAPPYIAYCALSRWFTANSSSECHPTHWLPEAAEAPRMPPEPLDHHQGPAPSPKAPHSQASQCCAPVEEVMACPDCHLIPVVVQLSTEGTWIAGCMTCNGGLPQVRGATIEETVRAWNAHACGRNPEQPAEAALPCPRCHGPSPCVETNSRGDWVAWCAACNTARPQVSGDTRSEAVKEWNRWASRFQPPYEPSEDLLPCPQCRGNAFEFLLDNDGGYRAGCSTCNFWIPRQGGVGGLSRAMAALGWNNWVMENTPLTPKAEPAQASELTPGALEKQAKPVEDDASEAIAALLLDKLAAAYEEIARLKQAPNINQVPLNPLSDLPCTRCGGEPSLRKFGEKSYVECTNCNNKTFPAISADEAWWLWKTFSKSPKNPFEPRPK